MWTGFAYDSHFDVWKRIKKKSCNHGGSVGLTWFSWCIRSVRLHATSRILSPLHPIKSKEGSVGSESNSIHWWESDSMRIGFRKSQNPRLQNVSKYSSGHWGIARLVARFRSGWIVSNQQIFWSYQLRSRSSRFFIKLKLVSESRSDSDATIAVLGGRVRKIRISTDDIISTKKLIGEYWGSAFRVQGLRSSGSANFPLCLHLFEFWDRILIFRTSSCVCRSVRNWESSKLTLMFERGLVTKGVLLQCFPSVICEHSPARYWYMQISIGIATRFGSWEWNR